MTMQVLQLFWEDIEQQKYNIMTYVEEPGGVIMSTIKAGILHYTNAPLFQIPTSSARNVQY